MGKLIQPKIIKNAFKQTWMGFFTNIPLLLGIILLIALIHQYFSFSSLLATSNHILAIFGASIVGSISAGNPINSYIIASELGSIDQHVFIVAIFLVAWITVGIVQIPAESYYFGKRFAFMRNLFAWLFTFVAGGLIYLLYYFL